MTKRRAVLTAISVLSAVVFTGCAHTQTHPDVTVSPVGVNVVELQTARAWTHENFRLIPAVTAKELAVRYIEDQDHKTLDVWAMGTPSQALFTFTVGARPAAGARGARGERAHWHERSAHSAFATVSFIPDPASGMLCEIRREVFDWTKAPEHWEDDDREAFIDSLASMDRVLQTLADRFSKDFPRSEAH